jgi:hypothetical protein
MLTLIPLDLEEANFFVKAFHRHNGPVQGHKFSLGAVENGEIVGVAIIGRPLARGNQDGRTLEIARLCVKPNRPRVIDSKGREHADPTISFLEGKAVKAILALGYKRVTTYTLKSESGAALRAAGFRIVAETDPSYEWDCPSRPRVVTEPNQPKFRWEFP